MISHFCVPWPWPCSASSGPHPALGGPAQRLGHGDCARCLVSAPAPATSTRAPEHQRPPQHQSTSSASARAPAPAPHEHVHQRQHQQSLQTWDGHPITNKAAHENITAWNRIRASCADARLGARLLAPAERRQRALDGGPAGGERYGVFWSRPAAPPLARPSPCRSPRRPRFQRSARGFARAAKAPRGVHRHEATTHACGNVTSMPHTHASCGFVPGPPTWILLRSIHHPAQQR